MSELIKEIDCKIERPSTKGAGQYRNDYGAFVNTDEKTTLSQFYGGLNRGICLQISTPSGTNHAQFTVSQSKELVKAINDWIQKVENK